MVSITDYESCVEYVKSRYGGEFIKICNVKEENMHIEKDLVVGWLLTRYTTIDGRTMFNIHPIVYKRYDKEGREDISDVALGYNMMLDDLCGLKPIEAYEVLEKEEIVKILPAQPNTYYLICWVDVEGISDCRIPFVIGVMHNPSTEEIVNIVKNKYYVWLKSYEFEKIIKKLKAKSKSD
jgi:hypothetical protein